MTEQIPNPIDEHVGRRIRERRRAVSMSQSALADRLKITFQQVQKYERGSNRVSASKLLMIAQALRVQVAWFFIGVEPGNTAEAAYERKAAAVWLDDARLRGVSQKLALMSEAEREQAIVMVTRFVESLDAFAAIASQPAARQT